MARIYKPTYTQAGRDGKRVKRTARKWYVEYRDSDGQIKRAPGYTDKVATEQLAARLVREAERRAEGIFDRHTEQIKRPLAEHVADWKRAILDNGKTEHHARLSANRVTAILDGAKITTWQDLSASKVQGWIAAQRDVAIKRRPHGLSIESANHYIRAIKGFARWMIRDGRAPENPVAHLALANASVERRHERRAFTTNELTRLLAETEAGPSRYGPSGPERAMLYRVAVETGLRSNELRSLSVASFDLSGDSPSVTVAAGDSKRRRTDTLPIRPALVKALRAYFANKLPTAPAFRMPNKSNVVRMLRTDMKAARAAWIAEAGDNAGERERRECSTFLRDRDDAGRVADFHAFRHTFVSLLAQGGVHPKIAQQLARHSTITLTMDRYTHTLHGDLSDSLNVLPDLDTDPRQRTRQRATGTLGGASGNAVATERAGRANPDGRGVERQNACRSACLSACETPSGESRRESPEIANTGERHDCDTARKANNDRGFDASCRRESFGDGRDSEMGRAGIEPATHGFSVRCSTN